MTDEKWVAFFKACRMVLGEGESVAHGSVSWCSWTTYWRLNYDAMYNGAGIPHEHEIWERGIRDGGTWRSPFYFSDIAHIIIPKKFYWETRPGPKYQRGERNQDITTLSKVLKENDIPHRLTDLVLEMKFY